MIHDEAKVIVTVVLALMLLGVIILCVAQGVQNRRWRKEHPDDY